MRSSPAGAAHLAPQIAQLHRKLFARLDGDRDNRLSFGEIRDSGILRKAGVAHTDAEEKAAFERADTNHDGVLSRGESFDFFNGLMQADPVVLAVIAALVGADEDPAVRPSAAAESAAEHDAAEDADEAAAGPHVDPAAAAPPRDARTAAYAALAELRPAPARLDLTA